MPERRLDVFGLRFRDPAYSEGSAGLWADL
jgi:hypothetical protein